MIARRLMLVAGLMATAGAILAVGMVPAVTAAGVSASPQPVAVAVQAGLEPTSCVSCHFDPDLFEADEIAVIEGFTGDVHAAVGLSCHDCHGGNPDPALSEDYIGAKDDELATNPYRGRPDRTEIPVFCGTCHSSPDYMRRFGPAINVDQESEYRTSVHGNALAAGDTNVATCVDCHGTHGIRRPSDPESQVYATRVAETCSGCHADVELMSDYTLPDGRPLPVDQYARWRESVHAAAMFDREDLSAPTCNDCHGNHGASPPGLDSVSFVCGQCHGREAELFRSSPKRDGFRDHTEYLADAGSDGCAACHDLPEPAATLTEFRGFGECSACHGNHGIVRPTLSFLSPLPETPCAFCHAGDAGGSAVHSPEPVEHLEAFQRTRDGLLAEAASLGLTGDERFDWLVDRAELLAPHTRQPEAGGDPVRRPEFERLFTKFRIGKTSFTYEDPSTGEPVRVPILRCNSCHAGADLIDEDAIGGPVAGEMLAHMRGLTAMTAAAERVLLESRRGGVETRGAALEVEHAIDAQISLEVMLHGFSVAADSEFVTAHTEGMAHAAAALEAGEAALGELRFRRQGLAVALAVIVLVLIALALKIRDVSTRPQARAE